MNIEEVIKEFKSKNYIRALEGLNKLILKDQNSEEKFNLQGVILQLLDKSTEAKQSWQKAIKLNIKYFDPYFNLGNIFMSEMNYSLAEVYYNKASKLQPKNFKIFYQLGFLFMKMRNLKKSCFYFNKSQSLNGNFAPTYYNLGIVLNNLNKKQESVSNFEKAINLNPNYTEAFYSLGITYREIKKFNLSKDALLKALKLDPSYPFLKGAIRFIKNNICDWESYEEDLIDLETDIKNNKKVITPWQGLSLFESPEIQLKNTILFSEKKKRKISSIISKKKITIAYFSADFCEHAVSHQISKILKLHDKNKFEIYGFYLGIKKDTRLKEIKNSFDKFFYISDKSTTEILKLVKDLSVDIAIDLGGFTKSNRYEIFNSRCAPLQVSFLGFAGTTGLTNMDYIIGDTNVILEKNKKFFTENVIFMPNSFMPTNDSQKISEKKVTKIDEGLPENSIVYCCFNKHYKITPKIFDLWIKILNNVEKSILWLNDADDTTQFNIIEYSKKKGLDKNRIYFTKRSKNYEDYLAKHCLADIFLDTSPFSAHSTGCSSLIAGVPIITLQGKSFSNNVSSSLLKAMDISELITKSSSEYVEKAVDLGNNSFKIIEIKEKIKKNFFKESLFNSKLYTKNLEKAFIEIYNNKINNFKLKDIYIS